jgi:hypothetical protein
LFYTLAAVSVCCFQNGKEHHEHRERISRGVGSLSGNLSVLDPSDTAAPGTYEAIFQALDACSRHVIGRHGRDCW